MSTSSFMRSARRVTSPFKTAAMPSGRVEQQGAVRRDAAGDAVQSPRRRCAPSPAARTGNPGDAIRRRAQRSRASAKSRSTRHSAPMSAAASALRPTLPAGHGAVESRRRQAAVGGSPRGRARPATARLSPTPTTARSGPRESPSTSTRMPPELSAAEHDVVRPLERDAGGADGGERAHDADAGRQRQGGQLRGRAGETPADGQAQPGAEGRHPAPPAATAAAGLVLGERARASMPAAGSRLRHQRRRWWSRSRPRPPAASQAARDSGVEMTRRCARDRAARSAGRGGSRGRAADSTSRPTSPRRWICFQTALRDTPSVPPARCRSAIRRPPGRE